MERLKPKTNWLAAGAAPSPATAGIFHNKAVRETVESIAIALILAFLFRAFEAEAFVIPTGSMAPTLKGLHKDVVCGQCRHQFQTGVKTPPPGKPLRVDAVTCPICGFVNEMQPQQQANDANFSGDRILVNKFAYDLAPPQRWDIIVFKFPDDAKTNYIKRLIGLPGEAIRIFHGDIFVKRPDDADFRIARKPPHKLLAMLQTVDDTDHVPQALVDAGWPARWQNWSAAAGFAGNAWQSPQGDGRSFTTSGEGTEVAWLRYEHVFPTRADWEQIGRGQRPRAVERPITDFVTYNQGFAFERRTIGFEPGFTGQHWVGDLALEATVHVTGSQGDLLLKLVEAGRHYECRLNVATGEATLAIDGGEGLFGGEGETQEVAHPAAPTGLVGPGTYRLRFANVDNEIRLWLNGRLVEFNGPTTYVPPVGEQPAWSPKEPGDMSPLGIGSQGLAAEVEKLRVFRDVYYIASNEGSEHPTDYNVFAERGIDPQNDLTLPGNWRTSRLFKSRRTLDLPPLAADQFLPLGDNSAQSSDARMWENEQFVRRDLLIGKAFFVYFPHPWNGPVPFTPNFGQMRLIR